VIGSQCVLYIRIYLSMYKVGGKMLSVVMWIKIALI